MVAALAEIQPLRGVRFNTRLAGPVGPLLAPPYDVMSANGDRPEYSISGIENAELGLRGNQHRHAAERYNAWLADGVLARDDLPAIYLHRHRFLNNGEFTSRTGLMARVRLRDWSDRVVLPHERTNPGPRSERLDRLRAVGANLSPLYFLYRDACSEAREVVAEVIRQDSEGEALDRTGGTHQFIAIVEPRLHDRLQAIFADKSLFVADGHHRYEAALAYRNEMRGRYPGVDGPWEYVLALLSAVEDPGVLVRPTHRLLSGGDAFPPESILDLLGRWFAVDRASGFDSGLFRLVLPGAGPVWQVTALPGAPHLALLPRARGVAWRGLAVSAVEGVLESLIGSGQGAERRRVEPVVDEALAVDRVQAGSAHAAFLLPAPELDRLLAVAEEGDLLPPKSTWFEPKAPAGLVINDFRLSNPVD